MSRDFNFILLKLLSLFSLGHTQLIQNFENKVYETKIPESKKVALNYYKKLISY